MSKSKKLKALEHKVKIMKRTEHNNNMKAIAKSLRKDLLDRMTPAELRFKHVAESKGIKLECQYEIDIKCKREIQKFYFADFCDTKNRIIFEVDGDYHFTPEQEAKDLQRTRDLRHIGYKVFRITNAQVYKGLSTALLYHVYHTLGYHPPLQD